RVHGYYTVLPHLHGAGSPQPKSVSMMVVMMAGQGKNPIHGPSLADQQKIVNGLSNSKFKKMVKCD
ncbi:MAG: hypothetical protein LBT93_05680, partial [Treponema sp.]|nr:hypothetical protein [Treponema sp.]